MKLLASWNAPNWKFTAASLRNMRILRSLRTAMSTLFSASRSCAEQRSRYSGQPPMNVDESTKLALEHARSLFIYHAGQRIESLNRYFVTITVFLTGFGVLANSKLELGDRALFGL